MRSVNAAFAFVALVFLGQDALADVASEARFFDDAGRRAYQAGDYPRAIESFQLLQEIAPAVGVMYNIALCADLAGRGDMAFSLYGEYLKRDDPDLDRRAAAERRVARLKDKLALVQVQTDPPGATVYVGRKELGQFGETPVILALPEGEHRLLVERQGFQPADVSVTARTGSLARASAALTPLFGRVVVNVTPGTTRLRFVREGVPIQATLERGGYRLQVGTYQVMASAPGYAALERQVAVTADGTRQLDLGLVPLPRATGLLLVSTGTVSAEVFVDGRRVAMTPAALGEMPVGSHVLEVRTGKRSVRRTISIAQAKPLYLELDLGEAP